MEDIIFDNWLLDLQKKCVDAYTRAVIIDSKIKEKNTSQREFARRHNLSHSTVQDWLLPLKFTEEEYKKMCKEIGQTKVYRILRNNKELSQEEVRKKIYPKPQSFNTLLNEFYTYITKNKKIEIDNQKRGKIKVIIARLNQLVGKGL